MKKTIILMILSSVIFIISLTAQHAFAYLDPGTGSMLLQGLLAGLLAAAATIRIFWKRIKIFFYRFTNKKDKSGNG